MKLIEILYPYWVMIIKNRELKILWYGIIL